MKTIRLTISDETLRDGEQQADLFFDDETKRNLAHLIAKTGVDRLALMPAVHEREEAFVKSLIEAGFGSQITASTMMGRQFIEQSKACGVEQIILFYGISDRLLCLRDLKVRDLYLEGKTDIPRSVIEELQSQAVTEISRNIRYARDLGLKICFAAEDASRTDFDFLVECINAFKPDLESFLLCDTLGVLTPEKTYVWLRDLLEYTDCAPLSVHFHNDLGLALENTIQAVLAGATGVSGTFGGIGERAGNVALEQVLNGLRMRFGWEVEGIDYEAMARVTDYLELEGIRCHAPYSRQAQRYETGIHVHGILYDRQSYCIFPHSQPEIWFGRCSGASNFQYLFEHHLQKPLNKEQYERLRSEIKAISIQQRRSFSTEEVLELLANGTLQWEE